MKKSITKIFTLLMVCSAMLTLSGFTSPSPEYFEGKWDVTVKDTPQGTVTIPMRFETMDGVTKGYFMEDASGVEKEMSSVSITEDVLSASFNIAGYDVYMSIKKVGDENANGSLMDMFTTEAKKVK
jgi:hypothetical protein